MNPSPADPAPARSYPGQSLTGQSRTAQSRADQSRTDQSRADQSRTDQSRADQSRADQSRTDQSRADRSLDGTGLSLADIGAEAVLIAGGGRAILLQLANPAVGIAVARHSSFAADPTRRLRHTLSFVYALVFGSVAQQDAVRSFVNRAHAPVVSGPTESPDYRATDARLQLWVAATLFDTAMAAHELFIGPLSEASRDRIYRDYEYIGTALQLEPGMWPANRAAFAEYWSAECEHLSVSAEVHDVVRELLHPATGPLWLRLGVPLARLVTAGMLPAPVRELYGFAWTPARARRYRAAVRAIRVVNRMLPRSLRHLPMRRSLESIPV